MYILQICNTFSQEILHQETYGNPDTIESIIESSRYWQECYIYDDKKRAYKGRYLKHSITEYGDDTIYKVFFDVGLANLNRNVLIEH